MRPEEAASLGRAIAARRRAAGLTQVVMAHTLGVGAGAVKTWELGAIRRRTGHGPDVYELPAERLAQLAELFGCTPADILDATIVSDDVRVRRYGVPPLAAESTVIAGERFDLTDAEADKARAYVRGLIDARDLRPPAADCHGRSVADTVGGRT